MADVTLGQQFGHWVVQQLIPSDCPRRVMARCSACGSSQLLSVAALQRGQACHGCRLLDARQWRDEKRRVIASNKATP